MNEQVGEKLSLVVHLDGANVTAWGLTKNPSTCPQRNILHHPAKLEVSTEVKI